MPAIKKVNDHYYITAPEVTITGNLTVSGAQASVTSTDSVITDKVIVLNNGEASAGITGNAVSGIEVDRGGSSDVSLVWSEANSQWMASDGSGVSPYQYALLHSNNFETAYSGNIEGGSF